MKVKIKISNLVSFTIMVLFCLLSIYVIGLVKHTYYNEEETVEGVYKIVKNQYIIIDGSKIDSIHIYKK